MTALFEYSGSLAWIKALTFLTAVKRLKFISAIVLQSKHLSSKKLESLAQNRNGTSQGNISTKIPRWMTTHLNNCTASNDQSSVGNVSGYRCVSECRSRDRDFDPGPVPYFCGDWSWNNFYSHSPAFGWIIQEGLLSATSKSMCTKYWLNVCSSLSRKKVWLGELTVQPWP